LNWIGSHLKYKSDMIVNSEITKIVHTILVYIYIYVLRFNSFTMHQWWVWERSWRIYTICAT